MNINEKQIDGNHYKDTDYQVWDFAFDSNLHYLLLNPIKYVYRWRKKGGVKDLEKAVHYLEKIAEIAENKLIEYTGFGFLRASNDTKLKAIASIKLADLKKVITVDFEKLDTPISTNTSEALEKLLKGVAHLEDKKIITAIAQKNIGYSLENLKLLIKKELNNE